MHGPMHCIDSSEGATLQFKLCTVTKDLPIRLNTSKANVYRLLIHDGSELLVHLLDQVLVLRKSLAVFLSRVIATKLTFLVTLSSPSSGSSNFMLRS